MRRHDVPRGTRVTEAFRKEAFEGFVMRLRSFLFFQIVVRKVVIDTLRQLTRFEMPNGRIASFGNAVQIFFKVPVFLGIRVFQGRNQSLGDIVSEPLPRKRIVCAIKQSVEILTSLLRNVDAR